MSATRETWDVRFARYVSRHGGIVSLPVWALLFALIAFTSWGVVVLWAIASLLGVAITGAFAQEYERLTDEGHRG